MQQMPLFGRPALSKPLPTLAHLRAGMADANLRLSLAIRAADPQAPLSAAARQAWQQRLAALTPDGGVVPLTLAELDALEPALVAWARARDRRLGTQVQEQCGLLRQCHLSPQEV